MLNKELPVKKLPDKDGVVICIASGKGGVGKTFIGSVLAYAFASTGLNTLLIDMDTGLRNLDMVLGLENSVCYNLLDVLQKKVDFSSAVVRANSPHGAEDVINLPYVLLPPQGKTKNAIARKSFAQFLEERKREFDIILLDAPAGIEYGFSLVSENCDRAIIVCTPEMPIVYRLGEVIGRFDDINVPIDLIVNQMYPKLLRSKGGMTPQDIELETGYRPAALIPLDLGVRGCANTGVPVWYAEHSSSRKAICLFAQTYLDRLFADVEEDTLGTDKIEQFAAEEPLEYEKLDEFSLQESQQEAAEMPSSVEEKCDSDGGADSPPKADDAEIDLENTPVPSSEKPSGFSFGKLVSFFRRKQ